LKQLFAVVALAAISALATAAPLGSQPTFMPNVTLAVAPLYEISLEAGLSQLTVNEPALIVLGLQPAVVDPPAPSRRYLPFACVMFLFGTAIPFAIILVVARLSLRPHRHVVHKIRRMASV
jgi:hypothetical protein